MGFNSGFKGLMNHQSSIRDELPISCNSETQDLIVILPSGPGYQKSNILLHYSQNMHVCFLIR